MEIKSWAKALEGDNYDSISGIMYRDILIAGI